MTTSIQHTDTYRQVFAWLRGGDATPDPQMENNFLDLVTAAVAERLIANRQEYERMARAAERAQRRLNRSTGCLSIKAMLEEVRNESTTVLAEDEDLPESEPVQAIPVRQISVENSESSSCELDSVLLAKVLRHMAVIEGIDLSQSQIQSILYIAYGVRLAQKNVRLISEHPQVWQYGPVFPRAYNKLRKDTGDGTDEYYSLKADHPDIFNYLENCFRRYAWTKACVLVAPHLSEGTPWSQTRKSNPDRWGMRIEDELIREWFLPRV